MQIVRATGASRDGILEVLEDNNMAEPPLVRMLDYTINLFERKGLGQDYYGYHNIHHELAVTYLLLRSACNNPDISIHDTKHLYAAALLHDFDPLKSVDKPHEKSVVDFISHNSDVVSMMQDACISMDIVKALIHRTTYPWIGEARRRAENAMEMCFEADQDTRDDTTLQEHYRRLGLYLSVADRVGGYALGSFADAMEMAKMNAHALAWRPSLIVRRSVAYFEDLLNSDTEMFRTVMGSLPRHMRKNFFDTVLSFMDLRRQEIAIQADYTYDNLRLVPTIDTMDTRRDPGFAESLLSIFNELPRPLQFDRENFVRSVADHNVILNTLRLNDGRIIGFAKGGHLENYTLSVRDDNYGLFNTVFLEPLALKMGYWGLGGGSKMRHLFVMQSYSKRFTYLTSFALRDVIQSRVDKERAQFVKKIDPERWDYYRISL